MNNSIELLKRIKLSGISFGEFMKNTDLKLSNIDLLRKNESENKLLEYTKLNQKRTERILKTYKPNDEIINAISKIDKKQTWLIITEDWCGDSAQNVPYIFQMTKLNKNIDFKIIYRDENLDVIDQYLTNGGRAIPKIIGFDEEGNEVFQWGPRPETAKLLVKEWKESGLAYSEFSEKLHLWYGKDRGKTVEAEFLALLK